MEIAHSVNGVPIRLTYERWYHITENHDDLASHFHDVLEAIQKPDFVVCGNKGSLKATRNIGKKKWLIVIYKEVSKRDGFVITAYFLDTKPKGKIIWRQ
jgi:S1-C subfamily serine protease